MELKYLGFILFNFFVLYRHRAWVYIFRSFSRPLWEEGFCFNSDNTFAIYFIVYVFFLRDNLDGNRSTILRSRLRIKLAHNYLLFNRNYCFEILRKMCGCHGFVCNIWTGLGVLLSLFVFR